MQSYVDEKGAPPRNALQLCAFARNRGASLKYREVCDALGGRPSEGSRPSEGGSGSESCSFSQVSSSPNKSFLSEGQHPSPRGWRHHFAGASSPPLKDSSWSASAGLTDGFDEARRDRAMSLDQAQFRCSSPERSLQPAKLRYSWTLRLGDEPTEAKVELLYSRRTGKKQVLIDGKSMFKTFQQSFDWSWEHPESQARILLRSENGYHELFCEGHPGSALRDQPLPVDDLGVSGSGSIEDAEARRGSSQPLSRREPEGAVPRRGAPITPRGDRGVAGSNAPAAASAASASARGDGRENSLNSDLPDSARDTSRGASAATVATPQQSPRDASCRGRPREGVPTVPSRGDMTYAEVSTRTLASLGSPRPVSPGSRRNGAGGLGDRAASAPELRLDHLGGPHRSGAVPGLCNKLQASGGAPGALGDAPKVPRLLLPAPGGIPESSPPALDAKGVNSPVLQSQFRHSRSTPIFAKVKEYLSAARPAAPPSRPVAASGRSAANNTPLRAGKSSSLSSTAPVPPSPFSPSSGVSAPAASQSLAASNGTVGARQAVVEKVQFVAAAVRARLSASLSPAKRPPLTTAMLESLPEEGQDAEDRTRGSAIVGDAGVRKTGRSLVRTSSAPGKFQPFVDTNGIEEVATKAWDDEDLGFTIRLAGDAAQARGSAALANDQVTAPIVPRIQLDRNRGVELTFENADKRVTTTPPGTVALKPQQTQKLGSSPASNQYFMLQRGPVSWTPRGSSPAHSRLATTPDQGRTSTPASTALTPRHPQVVQMGSINSSMPASQLWSWLPSLHQQPLLSPFSASPARIRVPGSTYGYPPGGSIGSQVQRSGRVVVQRPNDGLVQSSSPAQLALDAPAGARSVGAPPGDRSAFPVGSTTGSRTPTTSGGPVALRATGQTGVLSTPSRRVQYTS